MIGAFLYLSVCSIRNRIRLKIRRLREPRYLIGLAVGLLYLYGTIFRQSFAAKGARTRGFAAAGFAQIFGPLQLFGSLFLFLMAVLAWAWPGSRRGITFTQSEVQFLFTAPVTRRQLVHYKLLRSQFSLLFGSVIATLFLRPASLTSSWMVAVGIWLMLTTQSLYANGVALRRLSLSENGRSGWIGAGVPLAVLVIAVGIFAWTVERDWTTLTGLFGMAVVDECQRLALTTPAWIVLWPFRTLVQLPLSQSPSEFLRILPRVLGLIVIMYLWAVRGDASFEEASAAQAEKRASMGVGRGRRQVVQKANPTPFALGLEGRPEFAILWKNLILVGRYVSLKTLIRLLPLIVVIPLMIHNSRSAGVSTLIAGGAVILLGYTILLGPQLARNDLRQDLPNLQVLKTWPVSGTVLMRGEILAPWVLLTTLTWLFLLTAAAAAGSVRDLGTFSIVERVSYTASAMLVAPGILLAQLVVQNGIAVMFPAWIPTSTTRSRGIDAMGQRLLMMAGVLLTLVASLVPAAIVAGGVAFAWYWATHVVLIFVPAVIIAIVMIVECVIGIEVLGKIMDRTDVSEVDPNE